MIDCQRCGAPAEKSHEYEVTSRKGSKTVIVYRCVRTHTFEVEY